MTHTPELSDPTTMSPESANGCGDAVTLADVLDLFAGLLFVLDRL